MAPLIGITTSHYTSPSTGWSYSLSYVAVAQAVAAVGGLPVLIPVSVSDDVLRQIYERLDGVLLPGGGDMDPRSYGAEKHPQTGRVDLDRDRIEVHLARWSVADDRPLFGICRGHQVINVALGGTLIQDIPSQLATPLQHDIANDVPRSTLLHDVTIDPDSRLAQILEATALPVNSLHHQSVEQAAPSACVTALAPDGVVEALEVPDKRFALSVQWHPEDLYGGDVAMRRLFSAFVEAAGERVAG